MLEGSLGEYDGAARGMALVGGERYNLGRLHAFTPTYAFYFGVREFDANETLKLGIQGPARLHTFLRRDLFGSVAVYVGQPAFGPGRIACTDFDSDACADLPLAPQTVYFGPMRPGCERDFAVDRLRALERAYGKRTAAARSAGALPE